MRLTDILREMNGEEGGMKDLRSEKTVVLTTQVTPMSDIETALNDLDNYGEYKVYTQNVNAKIPTAKTQLFGPPGAPPVKKKAAKTSWDKEDMTWRKSKIDNDFKFRFPDLDYKAIIDMSFDELPIEIRNAFYVPQTKQREEELIKSLTTRVDILDWYEDNGMLVFPRETNKNIPGDVTLEKVIKTVMANAGINDVRVKKKSDVGDGESVLKSISKFTQIKVTVPTRLDAVNLRKELQSKFVIPSAAYDVKENGDQFDLVIRNITTTQKGNIDFYLRNKGLLEEINEETRRMLVLAGIIK